MRPDAVSGRRLVLDPSALAHVSSAGLRYIVSQARRLHAGGVQMALGGHRGMVAKVLTLTGSEDMLALFADVESALQALEWLVQPPRTEGDG